MREDVHTKGIPALCASCEVRHRGVCGALHPDQLVVLARSSSRQRGRRGSQLIGESEAIDHYSNVLSGVVKLTKTLSDGRQQIVGLQFAPDFLLRVGRFCLKAWSTPKPQPPWNFVPSRVLS